MNNECKNRSDYNTSLLQVHGDYVGIYEVFTIKNSLLRIIIPIWLFLGIPGSILCIIVWTRPKMMHTSSVYLAALGVSDLGFFVCLLTWTLKVVWKTDFLRAPVICELFAVLYFFLQYLSPLFTLAFTVERYVLICLPFKGESILTLPRAIKTTLSLVLSAILLSSIQGYFFNYDYETQNCVERKSVIVEGSWQNKLLFYWNLILETLVFGIIPLVILILNVLVIKETRSISRKNQTKSNTKRNQNLLRSHKERVNKNATTTVMIMCVSFYFILSTIPVTIIQLLTMHIFWIGDECLNVLAVLNDPVWRAHFRLVNARTVIELVAQSHYAAKFYIYIITGKQFRRQFIDLFKGFVTYNNHMPVRRNLIEFRQNNGVENQDSVIIK